jgi:hypothetical protein
MAKISVMVPAEGSDDPEYDEALELLNAMSALTEQTRPTLNGTKMVDFDGRKWYGYDYDGDSWWITKSMSAGGPWDSSDPFEFTGQNDPSQLKR